MEVRVKIITNVKKEKVETLPDGRFQISVNADRKNGEANQRVIKLLAKNFGVDEKNVAIISGHIRSTKVVRISC